MGISTLRVVGVIDGGDVSTLRMMGFIASL